jgi:hypothetical protein
MANLFHKAVSTSEATGARGPLIGREKNGTGHGMFQYTRLLKKLSTLVWNTSENQIFALVLLKETVLQ